MPIFDFIRGTLESSFFNLPLDGPLNFIYLFFNFALILFASLSGIFRIFGN
jgi:hypothetical protein